MAERNMKPDQPKLHHHREEYTHPSIDKKDVLYSLCVGHVPEVKAKEVGNDEQHTGQHCCKTTQPRRVFKLHE